MKFYNVVSILCVILVCNIALASEVDIGAADVVIITQSAVDEQKPVPFAGVLFSTSAYAKLIAEHSGQLSLLKAENNMELKLLTNDHKLRLTIVENSLEAEKTMSIDRLLLKDQHIALLTNQILTKQEDKGMNLVDILLVTTIIAIAALGVGGTIALIDGAIRD